jgi:hypothetical protein
MGVIGQVAVAPVGADHVDGRQHAAGMVPVPVRQHDGFNAGEIDAELARIALERVRLRPGIEQQGVRLPAAMGRDQAGQSVIGAADALAGKHAHSLALQIGEFRFDVLGHARQAVSCVIDQNMNVPVDRPASGRA